MRSRARKGGTPSAPWKQGDTKSPSPAGNPHLTAQTRKVLLKHYRTKYGVRNRGGK